MEAKLGLYTEPDFQVPPGPFQLIIASPGMNKLLLLIGDMNGALLGHVINPFGEAVYYKDFVETLLLVLRAKGAKLETDEIGMESFPIFKGGELVEQTASHVKIQNSTLEIQGLKATLLHMRVDQKSGLIKAYNNVTRHPVSPLVKSLTRLRPIHTQINKPF